MDDLDNLSHSVEHFLARPLGLDGKKVIIFHEHQGHVAAGGLDTLSLFKEFGELSTVARPEPLGPLKGTK